LTIYSRMILIKKINMICFSEKVDRTKNSTLTELTIQISFFSQENKTNFSGFVSVNKKKSKKSSPVRLLEENYKYVTE